MKNNDDKFDAEPQSNGTTGGNDQPTSPLERKRGMVGRIARRARVAAAEKKKLELNEQAKKQALNELEKKQAQTAEDTAKDTAEDTAEDSNKLSNSYAIDSANNLRDLSIINNEIIQAEEATQIQRVIRGKQGRDSAHKKKEEALFKRLIPKGATAKAPQSEAIFEDLVYIPQDSDIKDIKISLVEDSSDKKESRKSAFYDAFYKKMEPQIYTNKQIPLDAGIGREYYDDKKQQNNALVNMFGNNKDLIIPNKNEPYAHPYLYTYSFPYSKFKKLGLHIIEENKFAPEGLVWDIDKEGVAFYKGIQKGWLLTHLNGQYLLNNTQQTLGETVSKILNTPPKMTNKKYLFQIDLTFDTQPFWRDYDTSWDRIIKIPTSLESDENDENDEIESENGNQLQDRLLKILEGNIDEREKKLEKQVNRALDQRKKAITKNLISNNKKGRFPDVWYDSYNRIHFVEGYERWKKKVSEKINKIKIEWKIKKLEAKEAETAAEFGKILSPYKKFLNKISEKGVVFNTKFGRKKMLNNGRGLYIKADSKKFYLYKWGKKSK